MAMPSYRGRPSGELNKAKSHLGLWFDRFFDWSEFDIADERLKEDRIQFIGNFVGTNKGNELAQSRLLENQLKLVHSRQGESAVFQSDWHWITGIGINHPLENGFSWHPTLGLPYLPASSVKGLVHSWCEQELDLDSEMLSRWFGVSGDDALKADQAECSGSIVFFDALPVGKVNLKKDIMTNHYGPWYELGDQSLSNLNHAPADWHEPNPTSFLVCDGLTMMFSIIPVLGRGATPEEVSDLMGHLKDALAYYGAGAKTAVGYGTMSPSTGIVTRDLQIRKEELIEQQQAQTKAKELETMSAADREIQSLKDVLEKPERTTEHPEFRTTLESVLNGDSSYSEEEVTRLLQYLVDIQLLFNKRSDAKNKKQREKYDGLVNKVKSKLGS